MLYDELSFLAAGGALLLGPFVIVRVLRRPGRLDDPSRLLMALIGVCTLNAAHPALIRGSGFFEPLEFALPPLLAAYARAAAEGEFRFRWSQLLHFVPLAAAVACAVWFTLQGSAPLAVSVVFWSCLAVQMAAYLGPSLRRFHRHQKGLTDTVSNLAPVDLGWLRRFLWVALALCLLAVAVLVLLLHDLTGQVLAPVVAAALAGAVWVLGLRGLDQRVVPVGSGPVRSGPERPALSPDDARQIAGNLERLFAAKKPHLDPDLDLASLAEAAGVPRNHLSFVINSELGMNFYELVNQRRVQEFRELARNPDRDQDKILTLALEAGFNSKPTFNKVVLKMTGATPSQVRAEEIRSRPSR